MDRRKRGLGISSPSSLNWALLGKWSWRFASKGDISWKQVIEGKYGKEEGS